MTRWLLGIGFTVLLGSAFVVFKAKPDRDQLHSAKAYERVVSLAPSMTETLVALNKAHLLVGVTIHCMDQEVSETAKIGSFAEPNFEAIIAQKPDLVLAVPHVMAKPILEKIASTGIEVFAHQPDSLDDIKFVITSLAQKFDAHEAGKAVNQSIDQAISLARNIIASDQAPTVLIAVSYVPFVVAGKNTFASEIIESMGLRNLADGKIPWPVWPLESLLAKPPAYVIITQGQEALPKFHNVFSALRIDDHRMRLIVPEAPIFNSPSPHIVRDIRILSDLFGADV